jgi:hypothetical protein
MLAAEPTESTDRIEPAEPMDRIEPAEPMDKIEPAEPMDKIDPLDPMLKMEPSVFCMRLFSQGRLPPGPRSRARMTIIPTGAAAARGIVGRPAWRRASLTREF